MTCDHLPLPIDGALQTAIVALVLMTAANLRRRRDHEARHFMIDLGSETALCKNQQ
jgi:hypothetical protein